MGYKMRKKIPEKLWHRYKPNYLPYYILLIAAAVFFSKGMDRWASLVFYLLSAAALADIVLTKDRANAVANWVLIAALTGGILLWQFCVHGEWAQAVITVLCIAVLAALFVRLWKRGLT